MGRSSGDRPAKASSRQRPRRRPMLLSKDRPPARRWRRLKGRLVGAAMLGRSPATGRPGPFGNGWSGGRRRGGRSISAVSVGARSAHRPASSPGRRRRQAPPCRPARCPTPPRHPFGPATGRSRGRAVEGKRRGTRRLGGGHRSSGASGGTDSAADCGHRLESRPRPPAPKRADRRPRCARQLLHRQRRSGSLAAGRKRVGSSATMSTRSGSALPSQAGRRETIPGAQIRR